MFFRYFYIFFSFRQGRGPFSYEDAKEKMAQWIDFYNNERLHGALLYLTPADYFEGRKESRLAERREKLHTADINRKAYWLQQQQA